MNWQINEDELDASQRRIYDLRTDLSAVVRGVAGSGKTNLALWRAKFIQSTEGNNNFSVLIYTKALRRFIEAGLLSIGIDPNRVIHYDRWKADGSPMVDYIIADESQDFSEADILHLRSKARKTVVFFGDNAQQLYDNTLKINDIAELTKLPIYDLEYNYRMPISVARFAQFLNTENNIIDNCKNTVGAVKPRVIKFNTWTDELDFIINEIKTRNLFNSGTESTAILLPFNTKSSTGIAPKHYSVESVKDYFNSKGFNNLFKINDDVELDFNSTLPKIMTYHSSKGLQFDTVFMPHCGENWHIYKNPFYVALTRTSRQLIITHSDKLSNFIQSIPANLGLYELN